MLTLHARGLSPTGVSEAVLAKVTLNPNYPRPLRSSAAFLYEGQCEELPQGFAIVLFRHGQVRPLRTGEEGVELSKEQAFIGEGDVLRVGADLRVSVLYRRSSRSNALLITEQCNSYCVMCSQPPKHHDDSHLVNGWLKAIPLIDDFCPELTITGGEPTIAGDRFFELVQMIGARLPQTALHILSNGRNFKDEGLAKRLADLRHPDLMLGIPLYSDIASIHDYVVQADGAYDETLRGILNLKKHGIRIELRVVIHAETYKRLPKLAEFIVRNLQFIDQVSLMGLELMGFARANLDQIWIDPADYQEELVEAVRVLTVGKVKAVIFNHQLCVLRPELRPFAVKSISDWKNEYMPECERCVEKGRGCGGFFFSAKLRYSDHIAPIES